jgi:hypothetical protein
VKIIIDLDIFDSYFDYFVQHIRDVLQKIDEGRAPVVVAAASPPTDALNPEQQQDDAGNELDLDDDIIVEIPNTEDNEEDTLAMERDNCTLWINQSVDWMNYLIKTSSNAKHENLKKELQTTHGRFLHVAPLKWFLESASAKKKSPPFLYSSRLSSCTF